MWKAQFRPSWKIKIQQEWNKYLLMSLYFTLWFPQEKLISSVRLHFIILFFFFFIDFSWVMEVKVVATSSVCLTMKKTSFFNQENSLTRDCILHNFCYNVKRCVFCYIHFQNNLFSSLLRSLRREIEETNISFTYKVPKNLKWGNITEIFHPFNLLLTLTC